MQSASTELVKIGAHLASEKVVALQSEADNLHQTLLSKIPEDDKPVLQSILERDTIETRGKMSAVKEKKLQRLKAEKQTLESMPVRTEVGAVSRTI